MNFTLFKSETEFVPSTSETFTPLHLKNILMTSIWISCSVITDDPCNKFTLQYNSQKHIISSFMLIALSHCTDPWISTAWLHLFKCYFQPLLIKTTTVEHAFSNVCTPQLSVFSLLKHFNLIKPLQYKLPLIFDNLAFYFHSTL